MRGRCHKDVPCPFHKWRRGEEQWTNTAAGLKLGAIPVGSAICVRAAFRVRVRCKFGRKPWGGQRGKEVVIGVSSRV
jgi:hypothetical protein